MASFNPDKTRAVLIGASVFPLDQKALPPIPAVRFNILDLARVFEDPQIIGIPGINILPIVDEASPHEIVVRLVQVAKEAEDALIVYYAGHGLVGTRSPELLLAAKNTTDAEKDYNAVRFSDIRDAINNSPAKKKLLILDCCFSGRALESSMASAGSLLQANIEITGVCSITSAPSNQLSIAPKGKKHTAFTGRLLHVLENGIDNQADGLTIVSIFDRVRRDLVSENYPEPQISNRQDGSNIVLAQNRFGKSVDHRLAVLEKLAKEIATVSELASEAASKVEQVEAHASLLEQQGLQVASAQTKNDLAIKQFKSQVDALAKSVESLRDHQTNTNEVYEKERARRVHRENERERAEREMRNREWLRSMNALMFYFFILLLPALLYGIPVYLVRATAQDRPITDSIERGLFWFLVGFQVTLMLVSFLAMASGVRRFGDDLSRKRSREDEEKPTEPSMITLLVIATKAIVRGLTRVPPRQSQPNVVFVSAAFGLATLLGAAYYLMFVIPR
jgi:hypothetical protein